MASGNEERTALVLTLTSSGKAREMVKLRHGDVEIECISKTEFLAKHAEELRRQKAVYPLGRPGTMREAANAALFLASDESSFVAGHALVVDGGLTCQLQDSLPSRLEAGISAELADRGITWP